MQDPLDRLAEEFTERLRRGERPTIEEYVERLPERADEIRQLFAAVLFIEEHGSVEEGPEGLSGGFKAEGEIGLPKIGDYRVIRTIGRGGMGVVYEAEQLSLGRRVALKVLPQHSRLNPSHLRRFQLEARSAAQLQHSNIVPVYDVDEIDGFHFYAMQFIPGRGLDEVIEELRRLNSISVERRPDLSKTVGESLESGRAELGKREAADGGSSGVHLPGQSSSSSSSSTAAPFFRSVALIGVQVAGALAYAHERGILHRDIKPSNLLLDMRANVWVADFGLAKAVDSDSLTHTGDFVGTLRYMGPERFDGWSDRTSDVYSLGATLYELLTLRPAFDGADRAALVRKIAGESPPPPRSLDPRIPRDLETIVLKAMEKEPRQRYQSAGQMEADLRRFLDGHPIVARRSSAAERSWLWCRRNPALASLAGALALILFAVAIGASVMAYDSRQKLRRSCYEEARARRGSGRVGQRHESLRAVQEAVRIAPGLDLRNEAIAALALDDLLRVDGWEVPGAERGRPICLDGKLERVFSGTPAGAIEVYRVGERSPLFRLDSAAGEITGLRLGPEDRLIAAVHPGELALWDLEERRALWRFKKMRSIWSVDVDLSRDGRRVATGGRDGTVFVLDARSGRELRRFSTGLNVLQIRFSPDSRALAVCGFGPSTLQLWDVDGAAMMRSFELDRPVFALSWSPGGDLLAAGCQDSRIYLWDPRSGERLRRLEGHDGQPVHLAFDPTGDLLASAGWDGLTCIWDPHSTRPLLRHEGAFRSFSADGRFIALSDGKSGETFEVAPRKVYRPLHGHTGDGAPFGAAFSPDGRWLATAGYGDGIRIRDLTTCREAAHLPAEGIRWVRFHEGGTSLLSGGDHGLYRWPFTVEGGDRGTRLAVGPPEALWKGAQLRAVDLAPGTGTLVVILDEKNLYTFAVSSPAQRTGYDRHDNLGSCAISPDGVWIAAGTRHGSEVPVWRVGKKERERALPVPGTSTVLFSPDGRWLVTANADAYRFWSTRTWEAGIRLPRERAGDVAGTMEFSPDGRIFAMTWTRRVIRLADAGSGAEIATLEAPYWYHPGWIAFDRGGTMLAATTPNHLTHLWDLRALRNGLAGLGLDWELPPMPAAEPLEREESPLEIQVGLGRLDPETRRFHDEIDKLTARIRRDPSDIAACLDRAWYYHQIGEDRMAIGDCNQVLKLTPDDARARSLRSAAFEALGEWQEAIAEREKVLAGRPEDPMELNNLAWLYILAPEPYQRPQRALELASRAVEKDPRDNNALNTLGVVYFRVGRLEEAGDVLRRALSTDGGLTMFDEIFLAMTTAKLGDRKAALRHFDAALSLFEEQSRGRKLTSSHRRQMQQFLEEARDLLGLE